MPRLRCIGDGALLGSDTMLMVLVRAVERATTGAASAITSVGSDEGTESER